MTNTGMNTDTILKGIILTEWEKLRLDVSPESYEETHQLIKDALETYHTVA